MALNSIFRKTRSDTFTERTFQCKRDDLTLMLELAERNVLCVLVQMPFNLAVLDMDAAEEIPEQFPEIGNWYIGGHSLGGSIAASCIADNADDYKGLVLLASYSTVEIAQLDVISLYGSEDGVLNMDKYEKYRSNFPDSAVETVIEGGNHALFGSYGAQDGDGTATITFDQQLQVTVDTIIDFMEAE